MSHSRFIFSGIFPNQQIELNFLSSAWKSPNCILVFAFCDKQLLFTHHKLRGWELPGGKCRRHELPQQAARRETFEESGAELQWLTPFGQYTFYHQEHELMIKQMYVAEIKVIHPKPLDAETDNAQLLPIPSWQIIRQDPNYSPLLKDDVYRLSLPVAMRILEKIRFQQRRNLADETRF